MKSFLSVDTIDRVDYRKQLYSILGCISFVLYAAQAHALTPEEACPQHPTTVIDGHLCNHTPNLLSYFAVSISNSVPGNDFDVGDGLTKAHAINDWSDIAGMAYANDGRLHAVRVDVDRSNFSQQAFINLDTQADKSSALFISNRESSVGESRNFNESYPQAVKFDGRGNRIKLFTNSTAGSSTATAVDVSDTEFVTGSGSFTHIAGNYGFIHPLNSTPTGLPNILLDAFQNWPTAMNDDLTVVGAGLNFGLKRAFVCDVNKTCQFLDQISFLSEANDINNNVNPIIVGTRLDPTTFAFTAVSWIQNQLTNLPKLSGSFASGANAVSDGGDIVGQSGNRATLWRNSSVHDLNSLLTNNIGITLQEAMDINRHGEILARAGENGPVYLLIPVENMQ